MADVLFGREHVEAYRASDGDVGHEWQPGIYCLLLTTTGRRSGQARTVPLIYVQDGDDHVVIASKGGADTHPAWYLNLEADPEVELQVGDQVMAATARTASGDEAARLWTRMAEVWPAYDDYAKKTDRQIPVVVLTPRT